jgi:hypothetical protein
VVQAVRCGARVGLPPVPLGASRARVNVLGCAGTGAELVTVTTLFPAPDCRAGQTRAGLPPQPGSPRRPAANPDMPRVPPHRHHVRRSDARL